MGNKEAAEQKLRWSDKEPVVRRFRVRMFWHRKQLKGHGLGAA